MRPAQFARRGLMITCLSLSPLLALGCASTDRSPVVPSSARLAASGNGDLSYRATEDCTVYLYDKPSSRLVFSGPLMKGQLFSVNHDADQLTVDTKVVQDKTPDIGNEHQILVDTPPTSMHMSVHDDAPRPMY